MPNELQAALADGAAELEQSAGETFVFNGVEFKAWQVDAQEVVPGRLPSAPDTTNTYEAMQATAPAFANGDKLTLGGVDRRVGKRFQANPTTGRFRFTLP